MTVAPVWQASLHEEEGQGAQPSIRRARFLCSSCTYVLLLYRVLKEGLLFSPVPLSRLYELIRDMEPDYRRFKARVERMMEVGFVVRSAPGEYMVVLFEEESRLINALKDICKYEIMRGGDGP